MEDAAVDHRTSSEGGIRYSVTRALESITLRRSGAVTTICEGLREEIVSRGIDEKKVTVIPNAVDVDRFTMNRPKDLELARSLGIEGDTIVGYIGSLINYEGLDLLVEAAARIRNTDENLRFLIVGGGAVAESLQHRIRDLGLEDVVTLTGHVAPDLVARYYSLIDICVYPRLSMRLTEMVTPLKPLEAMASGKLVVASDIGGHREMIVDNETGLLFVAGNAASLAARLRDAADWISAKNGVRSRARKYVETERTWHATVSRYVPVYEALKSQLAHA